MDNQFQIPKIEMETLDYSKLGDCVMHGPMPAPTKEQEEQMKIAWQNYIKEQEAEWERYMSETELCPTHGRIIMKNLDGTVLVTPEPPEYIKIGNSYWSLNETGKKRWRLGLDINDYRCLSMGIHEDVFKRVFE